MMICVKTVPILTESVKQYTVVRNWEMPSLFGYPSLEQLTDENANLRDENAMLRDEVSQLRSKLAAIGLS